VHAETGERHEKWLVIGAAGMFGTDLVRFLETSGESVIGVTRRECDIRDLASVRRAVRGCTVVVNAAGWTAVDRAEAHEADAFAVNATGAGNVARAAREAGARSLLISTDYVFDGSATEPYDTDHAPNPISAYGRSKAAGEQAAREADPSALIVRTAWLYGGNGPNFVDTMLRLAASDQSEILVVDDQIGQPTSSEDLSRFVHALVASGAPPAICHGTNAGAVSRFELASAIFEMAGADARRVKPCQSSAYPLPAPRPAYSVLAHDPAGPRMAPWRDALERYLSMRLREDSDGRDHADALRSPRGRSDRRRA
jgi:dTDP-4-dehydrorhamnose reductase